MSGRRVVVVGGGHNGLVCAIRLAESGHEVVVLEAAAAPGGALSSGEDTLPGFVHDHCAGFFPLTVASPAMRALPLERLGVEWVNPPVAMAHPFEDGTGVALCRDLDATVRSLDDAARWAGGAWRELVERVGPRRELVFRAALSRFPPVGPAAGLAVRLRGEAIVLARLAAGSSASTGLALLGHDRPAAWLAGSAAHSDLSPGAALGGAFALGLTLLGQLVGWPFPRGGAGAITAALVARLGELGGEVRCGAPVEAIEVGAGHAAGVVVRGGERVAADAVVATLSAGALAPLLPVRALPRVVERRLRRWRYGLGTFKLDLALSGPVPWTCAAARAAGVVHVAGELADLFDASAAARRGEVSDRAAIVVGQHSLHDSSRAPDGHHTLYAYARVPQRPALPDDAIADVLERRIERFAPGFRELVLARATRSPGALERNNPSLVGGDLGGGSYEADQQLLFRPWPELVRGRTPLPGLYVAGASVHPGGGVHGVSGDAAARAVVADARQPRRLARGFAAAIRRPG